jgi:hypothetical protein
VPEEAANMSGQSISETRPPYKEVCFTKEACSEESGVKTKKSVSSKKPVE